MAAATIVFSILGFLICLIARTGEMISIFNKELVRPPQELHSAASVSSALKPKPPQEILGVFKSFHSSDSFSFGFGNAALFAYSPSAKQSSGPRRLFCCLDEIYCVFLGTLNNLSALIKQYGLSKGTNEAMFVIEAYRTLRDRGPYPADQVLKDLDGSFGFVVYDHRAGSVFAALGGNGGVSLFWGIAADGSVVISDNLELIKAGCAKSFAPFPTGCMFHSVQGLRSFEHPTMELKPMPRIDSEGILGGSNFKVDIQSRIPTMPRVGSEANWAAWGSQA